MILSLSKCHGLVNTGKVSMVSSLVIFPPISRLYRLKYSLSKSSQESMSQKGKMLFFYKHHLTKLLFTGIDIGVFCVSFAHLYMCVLYKCIQRSQLEHGVSFQPWKWLLGQGFRRSEYFSSKEQLVLRIRKCGLYFLYFILLSKNCK